MEKKKISNKTFWIIIILATIVVAVIALGMMSYADEETYVGEFIRANKVYMPDNNIKLVIYFNETDNIKYVIFDDWDAKHSILLSNMESGIDIKIFYKDYVFRDCREIVGIEVIV